MTPEQFKTWRKGLKLTQQAAADALGISKSSVELYEAGRRCDDGRAVGIPRLVELACAAIAQGLGRDDGSGR